MRRSFVGAALAAVMTLVSQWAIGAIGYEDANVLAIEKAPSVAIANYTPQLVKRSFTMHELETATPWTDGELIRFRGPRLKDILTKYDLEGELRIEVFAFDEFVTQIKMQEIEDYNPILAIERACTPKDRTNGHCTKEQDFMPLPMKDAGPFFIVWPIEKLPDSYVPARNSIWVWFVVALRPAS